MNVIKQSQVRALGLVQLAILRVIGTQPARSFGVAIAEAVSHHTDREISDPQIYVALKRLETHGFVSSSTEEVRLPSKRSRGRPRKYYSLTPKGRRAIETAGNYVILAEPFKKPKRGKSEGKTSPRPKTASVVA